MSIGDTPSLLKALLTIQTFFHSTDVLFWMSSKFQVSLTFYCKLRFIKWSFLVGSISSTFYASFFRQYSFAKKSPSRIVIREKMHNSLLYEKCSRKMLMKLTPRANSTNILYAAIVPIFFGQKLQSQTIIREKLHKTRLYKKAALKKLVKFTPYV